MFHLVLRMVAGYPPPGWIGLWETWPEERYEEKKKKVEFGAGLDYIMSLSLSS